MKAMRETQISKGGARKVRGEIRAGVTPSNWGKLPIRAYFYYSPSIGYCARLRMPTPEKVILLVDDSADDVFFFKRELQKAALKNPVHTAASVDEATSYLDGAGEFTDRAKFPLPSIAIVDLHLPGRDGFEFLRWIGSRAQFRNIHLVVLTGVGRLQDINRAYQMGANSFLTKPIKAEDLQNLATGFAAYWRA